jgi:hypothetical protein
MYRDIKRDIEAGTLTIREYSPHGHLKGSLTISEESAAQILAGRVPPGYRVHDSRPGSVMIAARDGSGIVIVDKEALRLALNIEAMGVGE